MTDGKTLYLVRHAKSDWTDFGKSDFDRPLNPRGLRDAPAMGARLKQRGIRPERVICSPAERARQTMELLDLGVDPVFNQGIYEASVGTLLNIILSIDDRFASAMLIGHNPSMGGLVGRLSGTRIDKMPTCAVATVALASKHWGKAGSCPAELMDFDYPKRPA